MTTKASSGGSGYSWDAAEQTEREIGGCHRINIRDFFTGPVTQVDGRTVVLPDFRDSVKRGSKLMDAHMPDWWRHIDTSALDLRDEDMCVLGQTWFHYANGEALVRSTRRSRYSEFAARILGTAPGDTAREQGAKFGFNISRRDGMLLNYEVDFRSTRPIWHAAWEHLTKTWLAEIRKRQLKAERKALKKSGTR